MKIFKILLSIYTFCSYPLDKEEIGINIFIHGTTRPYVNFQNLAAIWKQDGIESSPYATINNYFREQKLSRKTQPLQDLGLKKIDLKKIIRGNASGAFANIFDQMIKKYNPNQKNVYFTYGWSGLLSHKERTNAAQKLCKALRRIKREANIMNKKLYIRIVCFSHGGTVALKLAKIKDCKKLAINELILYGMPVQKDTDYLIRSPKFKQIYHFYSPSDYVQGLDLLSTKYFFCHKTFQPRRGFKLPKKLIQIKVKTINSILTTCSCRLKNRACPHRKIPKNQHLRNPGHSELWNFGWTPNGYRYNFPLYPFPVAVFSPVLIQKIKESNTPSRHLTINIKPKQNLIEMRPFERKNRRNYLMSFISPKELLLMKKITLKYYKPNEDLKEEKNEVFREAIKYSSMMHNKCYLNTIQRCNPPAIPKPKDFSQIDKKSSNDNCCARKASVF